MKDNISKKKNNLIVKNQKSTILTWFSTHYQVENRDWELIKKYGNPYHPLWGYYNSDNPDILEDACDCINKIENINNLQS